MTNSIGKSIVVRWDGEDHRINVSNDLCNHLESSGINLFKMQIELNSGDTPKFFLLSNLITQILLYSGVLVSQDSVVKELTQDPDNSIKLYHFARGFMELVFPPVDEKDLGKSSKAKGKN